MKTLITMLMILSAPVYSQSIRLFDIDTTQFPLMKAKAYIYDKDGKYVVPDKSEVSVREQGIVRQMRSVQIGRAPLEVKVSVGISIDNTRSMDKSLFGEKALELGKRTAQQLSRLLNSGSEIALQTSGARERIVRDFTTDGASLSGLIDKITATMTTRSRDYLLDQRTGIVNILKRGKHKRVAIVCTDGLRGSLSEDELQMCKDSCAAYGVKVIAIIYSPTGTERQGIKTSLRDLALSTNGYYYDGIVTQESVDHVVREIYSFLQESEPCRVEWESVRGCQSENGLRNVEMSYAGATSTSDYTVASNNREYIEFSPKVATFTRPTIGKSVRHNVTLYARNASFNITGVLSSNNAFTMLPSTFSVKAGDSIVVTVEYNALDSGYAYSQFVLQSENGCAQEYYGRGGYPGISPRNSMLRITQPVGGELLLSGSDTLIRWEGVTPQDTVGLDFSTDNGITWYSIAPRAWGLQHRWRNIPDIETNKCKIRIIHYDQRNDTHENATLLKKIGSNYYYPKWSPQSDKIAASTSLYYSKANLIQIISKNSGKILQTFPGSAFSAQWSNNGKYIAIDEQKLLNIWDVETGKLIQTLPLMSSSYAWSPDDAFIGIFSDNTLSKWDVKTGKEVRIIKNIEMPSSVLKWSRDGRYLMYMKDTVFVMRNVVTGRIEKSLSLKSSFVRGDGIYSLSILSPSEKKILYTTYNSEAVIIDIESEQEIYYSKFDNNKIYWSPDEKALAFIREDYKSVVVWDVKGKSQIVILRGDTTSVESVEWRPDGKQLSVKTRAGTYVFDAQTGEKIQEYENVDVHWSPNSDYAVIDSRFIYDTKDNKKISTIDIITLNSNGANLQWSPDENTMAFPSTKSIVLWNKNYPDSLRILETSTIQYANNIIWNCDGSKIAILGDQKVIVLDVNTAQTIFTFSDGRFIHDIYFTSKANNLIVYFGTSFSIYNIDSASLYRHIDIKSPLVSNSMAVATNSSLIAFKVYDSVFFWDSELDSIVQILKVDNVENTMFKFSPDDTFLGISVPKRAGGDYSYLLIWDILNKKYKLSYEIDEKLNKIEIIWSNDSKKVVFLLHDFYDDVICLVFDVEGNRLLHRFVLHRYDDYFTLQSIALSPDGTMIAGIDHANGILFWDIYSGTLLFTIQHYYSRVSLLTLSWNKDNLFSIFPMYSSDNGTINLWTIGNVSKILSTSESNDVSIKIERPFWTQYPSIDIGDCIVGQTKDTMIVNFFTNTGIAPCTVKEMQFNGGYPTPSFSLITCHAPYTLASGKSHFIEVSFAPKEEGRFSGYLRLITPYNDTLQFNIIGRGVLPHLKAQDAFIDCGIVSVGNNKILADTIVLQNMIDEPITVTSIRRIFPGDSTYSIVSPDNTIVIPSNSEQKLSVKFMPLLQGRQSGEIAIYHDGIGSPFIVHLYGEGVENPSSVQEPFGEAGTKSSAHIFPNPAKTLLHCELEITQPETIQIILYSMMGETVAELHKYVDVAGLHTFNVQLETVPSGHYYLAVRSSSALQHIPVMIMK
ncbi:MAG TPA: choice-of-anchor D domain-containing protein [Candidatus Kapabacteria bacterium]|nr:choice-of-anchor D domain-containing protein [Candidatus Kapabacteria bacterium]